jgi:hypothetical protein
VAVKVREQTASYALCSSPRMGQTKRSSQTMNFVFGLIASIDYVASYPKTDATAAPPTDMSRKRHACMMYEGNL